MKKKKSLNAAQVEVSSAEWTDVGPELAKRLKARVEGLAKEARVKKDAVFTARLRKDDFDKFKQIAEAKRIPYQTLLGHVIHEYSAGTLVDVNEIKKIMNKKAKAS
jgi:predicted DNA binding CopG/RHH family protein